VARCRPEHDVKLLAWLPILVVFFFQCDGDEVCTGTLFLANLEVCQYHAAEHTKFSAGHVLRNRGRQGYSAPLLDTSERPSYLKDLQLNFLLKRLDRLPQPIIGFCDNWVDHVGVHTLAACDLVLSTRGAQFQVESLNIHANRAFKVGLVGSLVEDKTALLSAHERLSELMVLCTTLRYDAFTDDESMIGDAIRIQRTPLSIPAACSQTRTWSKAAAPRSRVTGSEHLGTHRESKIPCGRQPKLLT